MVSPSRNRVDSQIKNGRNQPCSVGRLESFLSPFLRIQCSTVVAPKRARVPPVHPRGQQARARSGTSYLASTRGRGRAPPLSCAREFHLRPQRRARASSALDSRVSPERESPFPSSHGNLCLRPWQGPRACLLDKPATVACLTVKSLEPGATTQAAGRLEPLAMHGAYAGGCGSMCLSARHSTGLACYRGRRRTTQGSVWLVEFWLKLTEKHCSD